MVYGSINVTFHKEKTLLTAHCCLGPLFDLLGGVMHRNRKFYQYNEKCVINGLPTSEGSRT